MASMKSTGLQMKASGTIAVKCQSCEKWLCRSCDPQVSRGKCKIIQSRTPKSGYYLQKTKVFQVWKDEASFVEDNR